MRVADPRLFLARALGAVVMLAAAGDIILTIVCIRRILAVPGPPMVQGGDVVLPLGDLRAEWFTAVGVVLVALGAAWFAFGAVSFLRKRTWAVPLVLSVVFCLACAPMLFSSVPGCARWPAQLPLSPTDLRSLAVATTAYAVVVLALTFALVAQARLWIVGISSASVTLALALVGSFVIPRPECSLHQYGGNVTAVALSDGSVAAGDVYGSVHVWTLPDGIAHRSWALRFGAARDLALNRSGTRLLAVGDRAVRQIDLVSGVVGAPLACGSVAIPRSALFFPTDGRIVIREGDRVCQSPADSTSFTELERRAACTAGDAVTVSRDSSRIAALCGQRAVFWDVASGHVIGDLPFDGGPAIGPPLFRSRDDVVFVVRGERPHLVSCSLAISACSTAAQLPTVGEHLALVSLVTGSSMGIVVGTNSEWHSETHVNIETWYLADGRGFSGGSLSVRADESVTDVARANGSSLQVFGIGARSHVASYSPRVRIRHE
jgi:hypothetical protein